MEQGQGAQRFHLSETNPNDSIGGGGCLCSGGRCEDRGGPYAVFPYTTTDSMDGSPHVVICAPCVRGVVAKLDDEATELVKAGEPTATVVDVEPATPEREPNPVTSDDYDDLVAI